MKFQSKPEDEKRTVRRPIRLTPKEDERIREAADIRQMDVAEFMRRAALGRKADVRYEGQVILELRMVVEAIRSFHKEYVGRGLEPPKEALEAIILHAIEAMKRIAK